MIIQDRECVMVEVSPFQVPHWRYNNWYKYKGHCSYILCKFML